MRRFLLFTACMAAAGFAPAQPLAVHPENPHVFLYKGKPLVIVGSGEHYGAVMNLDFDFKKYLETLGRDGLNTARLFTGPYKEKPGAFGIERNTLAPRGERYLCAWARSREPGCTGGGNKFDLARWDASYFTRLKEFVQEADKQGVIVEINLFSSFYGEQWQTSPFHPANNINRTPDMPYRGVQTIDNGSYWAIQEIYVRKMVRELNAFGNLYFEIQNEPWADNGVLVATWNDYIQREMLVQPGQHWRCVVESADSASLAWQKKVAAVIRQEEALLPEKHLISENVANFKISPAEMDANVDILNFHYALPEAVSMNRHLRKPVGFNETGFSGRSDGTYRRQAWRFMMSGGALFGHLDYSFTAGREDGSDTTNAAPGGGSPSLRRQLRVLKDFLMDADLVHRRPVEAGTIVGKGAFVWAMSDRRGEWAVYCEGPPPFQLDARLPEGTYRVRWIDARTGNTVKEENAAVEGDPLVLRWDGGIGEVAVRIIKL